MMLVHHITSRIPFRILDNMTTIASPHQHQHTHTHTHDKASLTLDMEHTTSPSTHKRKRESSIVHISHITSPTHTTTLISPRHLPSPSASCHIPSPSSHTEEKERHLKIARTEPSPSPSPSPSRSPHYEFAIPSIPSPSSRPSPSPPHHPIASPKPFHLSTFTSSVSSVSSPPISIHCPPPPSSSRAGQRNTFSFALPAAATSSTSTSTSSTSTIPRRRPSHPVTASTSTSTSSSPSHDPSTSMTSFSFFQRSSANTTSSSISAPTTTRSSSFSLPRLPTTTCVSPRTVQLSPLILSPRQPAQSPPFHALSSPASSPSLSALTSPSLSSSSLPSLSPLSTPMHQTTSQSFSSPAIPPSSSPLQSYSPAPGSPSTSRPAHTLHSNLYVLPSTSPSLTATASIPTLSPLTWKPANVQALRVRIPEAVGKITLLAPTPPDTKACLIRERERQREAEMNEVTCHVGRYHAVSTRKGIRRRMEDTYVCRPAYTCSSDAFFGVYDGHGRDGKQASEIAARMFPEQLKICEEFKQGDIMNAFRTCYAQVDAHTVSRIANGGTTATCIYLRERTLHIANVGDSRAMLCRNGHPHVLTSDHKPHDDAEKLRIEAAGGHVIYCATSWRVEGILNISRSIGDAKLKSYVTSTPDVTSIELTDDDDLLVIGTDGMWSVLSPERVLEIATAWKTPAEATEALARETTQRHSKDNICIMVISLKHILAQETPKWE